MANLLAKTTPRITTGVYQYHMLFQSSFRPYARGIGRAIHIRLPSQAGLRTGSVCDYSSLGKSQVTLNGRSKILPEFNLDGKVIIVTGGGRGLGLVQAEALIEAGATGEFHAMAVIEGLFIYHCIATNVVTSQSTKSTP